jgi:hypothetical protein
MLAVTRYYYYTLSLALSDRNVVSVFSTPWLGCFGAV